MWIILCTLCFRFYCETGWSEAIQIQFNLCFFFHVLFSSRFSTPGISVLKGLPFPANNELFNALDLVLITSLPTPFFYFIQVNYLDTKQTHSSSQKLSVSHILSIHSSSNEIFFLLKSIMHTQYCRCGLWTLLNGRKFYWHSFPWLKFLGKTSSLKNKIRRISILPPRIFFFFENKAGL